MLASKSDAKRKQQPRLGKAGPDGCGRCGQPHPKCTAHNRQGKPCGNPSRPGMAVCRSHGGKSPKAEAAAERRLIEQEVRDTLSQMVDDTREVTDPLSSLRRLGGLLSVWVDRLNHLVEERGLSTIDGFGVVRASPEAEMLRGYMQDLAKIATVLAKQPIEEKHANAAELAASREWIETRGVILAALLPYPDAYGAVVDALRSRDMADAEGG